MGWRGTGSEGQNRGGMAVHQCLGCGNVYSLLNAVGCEGCQLAVYCSDRCKMIDFERHRAGCPRHCARVEAEIEAKRENHAQKVRGRFVKHGGTLAGAAAAVAGEVRWS